MSPGSQGLASLNNIYVDIDGVGQTSLLNSYLMSAERNCIGKFPEENIRKA